LDKASPKVSKKAEKRKLKDSSSVKKKKEKDATLSEVETARNIENGTIKSKTEKKKSMPLEIKSVFEETEKTKNVKKKRSRIIRIVDSSDDEDHLPVSLDFIYNFFREIFKYIFKFINFIKLCFKVKNLKKLCFIVTRKLPKN